MKTKFMCEKCGKMYETEKEALDCEAKHRAEAERKKRLDEERSIRYMEIVSKQKELDTLIEDYNKDYRATIRFSDLFGFMG